MIELECQVCHDKGYIMPCYSHSSCLESLIDWRQDMQSQKQRRDRKQENSHSPFDSLYYTRLFLQESLTANSSSLLVISLDVTLFLPLVLCRRLKERTWNRQKEEVAMTSRKPKMRSRMRMKREWRERDREWMNPEGGWIVLKNTSLESPDESFAGKERERNWMCCWHCNHPSLFWSLESWEGW